MYYPINKSDRATGFLLRSTASSTIKGQHAQYVLLGDQPQPGRDATTASTRSRPGLRRRLPLRPERRLLGFFRPRSCASTPPTTSRPNGTTLTVEGCRAIDSPVLVQQLPANLRASANANYSRAWSRSSATSRTSSRRPTGRETSAATSAATGGRTRSRHRRPKRKYSRTTLTRTCTGRLPSRLQAARRSRSASFPFTSARPPSTRRDPDRQDRDGDNKRGLTRIDVAPTLRFPFTKLPFLTFNSSLGFRQTYWSESLDPTGPRVPDSVQRRYFTLATTITGRCSPGSGTRRAAATRRSSKHVHRADDHPVAGHANQELREYRQARSHDYDLGGLTSFAYVVNTASTPRRTLAGDPHGRDHQSYSTVTERRQSIASSRAATSTTTQKPSHSPRSRCRVMSPRRRLTDATFRTEYDTQAHALRSPRRERRLFSGWASTSAGWSVTVPSRRTAGARRTASTISMPAR